MSSNQTHVLVRYAEIGIKGNNRSQFELQLVRNIRASLEAHNIAFENITRSSGRIIISTSSDCQVLEEVFGIASWSSAIKAGTSIHELFAVIQPRINLSQKSFKVVCTRVDKRFSMTSIEVNKELGSLLQASAGSKVKMINPDVFVECEIVEKTFFYCTLTHQGSGGLPVGSSSQVLVVVNTKEELEIAKIMLKRGCTILLASPNNSWILELIHYSHGNEIKTIPLEQAEEASKSSLLVAVSDSYTNIKEYSFACPVVRPLIRGIYTFNSFVW